MKSTEMTDKQFSDYLFNQDKKWTYKGSGFYVPIPYTTFFDSTGKIIALVFYNNQECTRRIFI